MAAPAGRSIKRKSRSRFTHACRKLTIFVRSERSAQRVFESVQRYLTQRLKLVVNEQKSSVRAARGCEYLGFTFVGPRVTIKVSANKLKAFKRRIKELTGRSRGISMHRRLTDLNRYLLVQLGVDREMAIKHAISRKRYWRMSRMPAMRYAMPNKWLEHQGLLSLKHLWGQLAPLRGTA